MEKNGLIIECLDALSKNWENYQLVDTSTEKQALNDSLADSLTVLKKIGASHDLSILASSERVLLVQELHIYANSPEEKNSIKMAIQQLDEGEQVFPIVRDPQAYQKASRTYSSKRMEAGLPLDSFREFLKSHSTRLTNRLASPLSVPEKNILRQRKENLKIAKEIYTGMQCSALGLAPKVKGYEIER